MPNGLPFRLADYLELVDWTGRILRDDKRGAIPESTPQILKQLNIDPKHWCYLSQKFESEFKSLVGTSYHIKQACHQLGKQWVHGIRACEKFFLPNRTVIKQKNSTIAWPNNWPTNFYVLGLVKRNKYH
jgi:hypothetical protein